MEAGLEVAFYLPEKGLPFGSRFAIGDEKVGAFFMAKVASVKGGGAGVFPVRWWEVSGRWSRHRL